MFSHRRSPTAGIGVPVFNNEVIPWKDWVKYLGVILDSKLTYSEHASKARNKAIGAMSRLAPLINRQIGITNGLIIYKMLIRPIALYASTVWGVPLLASTFLKLFKTKQSESLPVRPNTPH